MGGRLSAPASARDWIVRGLRRGSPERFARRRPGSRLSAAFAILWLAGAVVVWNVVFDAHIVHGARDYVDRQQLFVEGRGPRVDMGQAMDAAKRSGLRGASLWSGAELAVGAALVAGVSALRRRRAPDARPRASR
jgi:hypothetical protein